MHIKKKKDRRAVAEDRLSGSLQCFHERCVGTPCSLTTVSKGERGAPSTKFQHVPEVYSLSDITGQRVTFTFYVTP